MVRGNYAGRPVSRRRYLLLQVKSTAGEVCQVLTDESGHLNLGSATADPVDLLSAWELEQLERLLAAL